VPFTFAGKMLELQPLPYSIMAIIFGYVIIYLLLVQIIKVIFYKKISSGGQMTKLPRLQKPAFKSRAIVVKWNERM
jgi:uncharacterized membrane protein